ncbi:LysR family transcriptional regulator, hydrogen peroxide-inducible genes activator [Mariprofundus aestuarium]|uniref:LysR family transcriptional regulator, hydrogen peroxide-inducible genes activator n=1 Tax=Mariprofundus aestuarium TaxID=1921086 RepID=A0A2K8KVA3_MARES|nr:hydrogen peroxide-inducible genes activator [Mariprofundus aestuarium]ATX78707.1 LysR family transcriptional regulator, hydrogen peroxide-inducible genes activator [Mariprofundus aestuarium]
MAPTIKQLKYLIALDEHLHFGKASASCFISQSAFSIAIKELETVLNVQLVDRTNKSVVITEAGRAVISQARHCIRDLEVLMSIASSEQEPLSGKLTLGVIPTIAPFLLPPLIPEVLKQFPKLQLFLREDKTAVIHEQLLDGKLDLILVALPFQMRGMTVMPLFKDPFLLACRRESRWINAGVDLASLPDESILLLEDGHCLRDHALEACHLRNSNQINRFSATSLQTLLQMVVADLGITFLPAMAKGSLIGDNSALELHPLPEQNSREIGLAWRKGSGRSGEFTKIGELLQLLHQG